ncbi:hypothetical protein D3C75_994840 [compost metagenome]
MKQFALFDRQNQASRFWRQSGNLMNPQLRQGLVGHQQHDPLHATGDQGISGQGRQVKGIAERAGLDQ